MLQTGEDGRTLYDNWTESQSFLENAHLLDRQVLEQEVHEMYLLPKYDFSQALRFFHSLVSAHIGTRIRERNLNYSDWPGLHYDYDHRRATIHVGHIENTPYSWRNPTSCASPDWLTDLYYQVLSLRITLKGRYKIGDMLYSACFDRVYVVYETDFISASEAADIEDVNDDFDAGGSYSNLCLPRTLEEENATQPLLIAQRGTIGTLKTLIFSRNLIDSYTPMVFIPGKADRYRFEEDLSDHDLINVRLSPYLFGLQFRCRNDDDIEPARLRAEAFLRERYPDIRMVTYPEFEAIDKQRVF